MDEQRQPDNAPRSGFEQDLRNAAGRAEEELGRLIRYINDEVVPDVRRHSSVALRSASDSLRALAEKMDGSKPRP